MNKRGFTIMELLLVLLIMGMVFTTASVGINHIISIKNEKEFGVFKEQIENAACVFVDLNESQQKKILLSGETVENCKKDSSCLLTTKDLLESGLINGTIINPYNKKSVQDSNYLISVTWDDGLKKCVLQYE